MSKKKKLIAIAFSDIHLHWWQKFNKGGQRTQHQMKLLSHIFNQCRKYKVPGLFSGDLIHDPYSISNNLLGYVSETFSKLNKKNNNSDYKVKIYSISGNHDQSNLSHIGEYPSNYINSLSKLTNWLQCIDYTSIELSDFCVHGIPYITGNVGLKHYISTMDLHISKPNILLLHTDYKGARDTSGRNIGSSENIKDTYLSVFDLVLCGHIHLYQKLSNNHNIYMVGATHQQSRSDRYVDKMGYLGIYSDMSIERVYYDSPRFIDVTNEKDIDNGKDYFTLVKVGTELYNNNIVSLKNTKSKISNTKIINMYCKDKGIDKRKRKLLKRILGK